MRKIAVALAVALLAVALHAAAMGLWHGNHSVPFHSSGAMLTCPMGYVCPVSPAVLKLALTSSPQTIVNLTLLLLAIVTAVCADAIERRRYRPPAYVPTPTSPSGLRSTFKRE
ncbi:MAG: hypothetical protein AAB554_01880 [Patescibacteria group bacterium]